MIRSIPNLSTSIASSAGCSWRQTAMYGAPVAVPAALSSGTAGASAGGTWPRQRGPSRWPHRPSWGGASDRARPLHDESAADRFFAYASYRDGAESPPIVETVPAGRVMKLAWRGAGVAYGANWRRVGPGGRAALGLAAASMPTTTAGEKCGGARPRPARLVCSSVPAFPSRYARSCSAALTLR